MLGPLPGLTRSKITPTKVRAFSFSLPDTMSTTTKKNSRAGTSVHSGRYLTLFEQLSPLIGSKDIDEISSAACGLIADLLEVEACSILLFDSKTRELVLSGATHIPEKEWGTVRLSPDKGLCGTVYSSGKSILLKSTASFAKFGLEPASRYGKASCVVVPLRTASKKLGVINIANQKTGRVFNAGDARLIEAAGQLISGAMVNAMQYHESKMTHTRLHRILDSLHVGVLAFDADSKITHVNQRFRELLGQEGLRIKGRHLDRVLDPAIHCVCRRLVRDSACENCMCQEDVRAKLGAEERLLSISATRVEAGAACDERGLLLFEDASEGEELERLRLADSLKSGFLRTISHELRTPLTVMQGTIPLLTSCRTEGNGTSAGILDKAQHLLQSNVRRLSRVVNTLLDVVEIENGSLQLTSLKVDLKIVIEDRINGIRDESEKKGLSWNLDLDPDLGPVLGDPERIGQSLYELFQNAITYSPESDKINVRTRAEGSMAKIHIGNFGPAIAKKDRKEIFEKFYQLDQSNTRQAGGCGLGLYLARNVALLHHGDLEIVDGEEGETVFLLSLPLATEENSGN